MKKLLNRAGLLGFSTALAVLTAAGIGEVYLRFTRPEFDRSLSADPVLGWASSEFRAFEPAAPASAGPLRVLFLGDSYLSGAGVDRPDERFPRLIESGGSPCSTAILASDGWSIDQQLWAYLRKGRAWKPDLVVVAFCANNDVSSIMAHHYGLPGMIKPYYLLGADGGLELFDGQGRPRDGRRGPRPESTGGGGRFWKRSSLYKALALLSRGPADAGYRPGDYPGVPERYRLFPTARERPDEIYAKLPRLSWSPQTGVTHASAYIHEDFPLNAEQWRLFDAILGELGRQVEGDGARLAVMLLPAIFNPRDVSTVTGGPFAMTFETPGGPFTFRSAEPRDRLAAACRARGVTFFDPTAEFLDAVVSGGLEDEVWPNKDDRHFSAKGHAILGGITGRWLRRYAPGAPDPREVAYDDARRTN